VQRRPDVKWPGIIQPVVGRQLRPHRGIMVVSSAGRDPDVARGVYRRCTTKGCTRKEFHEGPHLIRRVGARPATPAPAGKAPAPKATTPSKPPVYGQSKHRAHHVKGGTYDMYAHQPPKKPGNPVKRGTYDKYKHS
jgi:hypothetical protein